MKIAERIIVALSFMPNSRMYVGNANCLSAFMSSTWRLQLPSCPLPDQVQGVNTPIPCCSCILHNSNVLRTKACSFRSDVACCIKIVCLPTQKECPTLLEDNHGLLRALSPKAPQVIKADSMYNEECMQCYVEHRIYAFQQMTFSPKKKAQCCWKKATRCCRCLRLRPHL